MSKGHGDGSELPSPAEDRVLHSLQNLQPAMPLVAEYFSQLHETMGLIEYVLTEASKIDPRVWLSNDAAALACLARAYQGLQAAANLAVFGFYNDARGVLRGVYESAGVGRMLAHDVGLADKWLRKNEWVPDRSSRDFAVALNGGDEDAKIPYQQYYKRASASAHPAAITTLPFMFAADGAVDLKLYPAHDEEAFKAVAGELNAMAIFLAFCLRNACADPDVLPPAWHQRTAEIARSFTGDPMSHLDDDWKARQKLHDELQTYVRPEAEVEDFLRDHPNSLKNVRERADGE